MTTLFISDLHLDASRPAATSAFLNFLTREATAATKLYILGDLFEAWIGDDDPNPHHQKVVAAIAQVSKSGTQCFFMHGNRDFMVGKQFLKTTGMILFYYPHGGIIYDQFILFNLKEITFGIHPF